MIDIKMIIFYQILKAHLGLDTSLLETRNDHSHLLFFNTSYIGIKIGRGNIKLNYQLILFVIYGNTIRTGNF